VFAVILFALVFMGCLALLLARYGTNPAVERASLRETEDRRPRLSGPALRALVLELIERMGLSLVEEEVRGDARRLLAVRRGPFENARYVIFVEPSPPGDLVEQPLIVELAENVKSEWGAVGLLITPYRIEGDGLAGMDAKLELIDGPRLRALVAAYVPERLAELDRHRGFGGAVPTERPAPQPIA
jgi:hypothetical protein